MERILTRRPRTSPSATCSQPKLLRMLLVTAKASSSGVDAFLGAPHHGLEMGRIHGRHARRPTGIAELIGQRGRPGA